MAQTLLVKDFHMIAGGNTFNIDLSLPYDLYFMYATGSIVLVGDINVNIIGTPVEGSAFTIWYNAGVTTAGTYHIMIDGSPLPDNQLDSTMVIRMYYDGTQWQENATVTAWTGSQNIDGQWIIDNSIIANAFMDNSINPIRLTDSTRGYLIRANASGIHGEFDAKTSGQIVMGDGTDVKSQAVSGDITINGSGVTAIGANKVTTTTINTGAVTLTKLETILKTELQILDVSFVAGELGDFKITMPFAGSLVGIYAYNYVVIAGTDNGTIVPKNNAGSTMGTGTITFTASDARGTAYTSTPSTNNTFIIGDILTFTTAKATAGGKVKLSLSIIRS